MINISLFRAMLQPPPYLHWILRRTNGLPVPAQVRTGSFQNLAGTTWLNTPVHKNTGGKKLGYYPSLQDQHHAAEAGIMLPQQ